MLNRSEDARDESVQQWWKVLRVPVGLEEES
jgi:hypothetical protein